MNRRVGIIYNKVSDDDRPDRKGILRAVDSVKTVLKEIGYPYSLYGLDGDLKHFVREIEFIKPDVIINLCEDFEGKSEGEIFIASLLEEMGMSYTGSPPKVLKNALYKPIAKKIFVKSSIPTPRWRVFGKKPIKEKDLSFPVIIKPKKEDGSIGIDKESVVDSIESLKRKSKELIKYFGTNLMIEDYIDGREFNAAFFDGEILAIGEIEFDIEPRIVGYDAKWKEGSEEDLKTRAKYPANLNTKEEERIKAVALKALKVLQIRDYGRVDLRMDEEGNIFVLEVNPNPDISPGSGFIKALEVSGFSYRDFIQRLIEITLRRTENENQNSPKQ